MSQFPITQIQRDLYQTPVQNQVRQEHWKVPNLYAGKFYQGGETKGQAMDAQGGRGAGRGQRKKMSRGWRIIKNIFFTPLGSHDYQLGRRKLGERLNAYKETDTTESIAKGKYFSNTYWI